MIPWKQSPWLLAILISLAMTQTSRDAVSEEVSQEQEQPQRQLTKAPKISIESPPEYPTGAKVAGVEAAVKLEIEVDATGHVANAIVMQVDLNNPEPATSQPATNLGSSKTKTSESTTSESAISQVDLDKWGFTEAAYQAALKLLFEPAEIDGTPAAVRIGYTYKFQLPKHTPPSPEAPSTESPELSDKTASEDGISSAATPAMHERRIFGVIRQRGTSSKLAGIVVTIFRGEGETSEGFEAVTDEKGEFSFYNLPEGEWKILAESDGYYPFRTAETLDKGEVLDLVYYLEKGSYNPYDVTVQGARPKKEVTRRTLTRAEIVSVPGTLGDPILVVENLPGVARPNPASGDIIVRGSGPNSTGVFIDGIRVPTVFHFLGLRSVIPADLIDTIDFYPGNFSTFYGRYTGGIFDAHLKELKPDRIHGSADISLLDTSLYLEVPIGKTAGIAIAGRRSYLDLVLDAVVPKDVVNLTTAPTYYDYQILANWRPSPKHFFRTFFFGSDDRLRLLFANPGAVAAQATSTNAGNTTKFNRLSLEHQYTPSTKISNRALFTVGHDDFFITTGGFVRLNFEEMNFQLRDDFRWSLSDSLSLNVGFDGFAEVDDYQAFAPRPPGREGDPLLPDPSETFYSEVDNLTMFSLAPYLEAQWKIFDKITLTPGIRFDYFSRINEYGTDPRLIARYDINPNWAIKGGVALTHERPIDQELDPTFGNPDLKLIRAFQYAIGAEWKPLDHLSVDLNLFYKDIRRLTSSTGALVKRDGDTVPLVYDNGGRGRVYGMEAFIKHDFANNFRGWLSYTVSVARRQDTRSTTWRPFDFDQTHILNLVTSYRLPYNWEIGLRWRLVTGNPRTPYASSVFFSDDDDYRPVLGGINSARFPIFHQLDLRVDKKWVYNTWTLSAYLSLLNSYNRQNAQALISNYNYSEIDYVSNLPILPIIGMKAEF